MTHYYHVSTDGVDTNLQLYSLVQSQRYWNQIVDDYTQYGEDTERLRERCVFVIATLGLSISQLLGQNDPGAKERVGPPIEIWDRIVDAYGIAGIDRTEFACFIHIYNGCRHFGVTLDGSSHARIEPLSFKMTEFWFDFGHQVWGAVIAAFGARPGSDLAEIDTDLRRLHESYS